MKSKQIQPQARESRKETKSEHVEDDQEASVATVQQQKAQLRLLARFSQAQPLTRDGGHLKISKANTFGIVPDRMRVLLRYGENSVNTVTAAGLTVSVQTSLFDPDPAVGGQQPNGADQWHAFYKYAIVRRMRRIVKLVVETASAPIIGAIAPSRSSSAPSGMATILGYPAVKWDMGTGSGRPAEIDSGWINSQDMLGVTVEEQRAEFQYWGTAAANPAVMWYLHTVVTHNNASNRDVNVVTETMFDVEFFDRVPLAQS